MEKNNWPRKCKKINNRQTDKKAKHINIKFTWFTWECGINMEKAWISIGKQCLWQEKKMFWFEIESLDI